MPNHHKHLHRRDPAPNTWDDFTKGVADLNPFKDSTKTLEEKADGPSTVYATVYTTLPQTFTGAVAGYSTIGAGSSDETTTAKAQTTSSVKSTTTKAATSHTEETSLPESVVPSTTLDASDTTLAIATSHSSTSSKAAATAASASTAIAAAASSSSTASSSSSSSSDNSGAKAGIAFGVLGGLLLFGLLAWFLFNKRKKQMEQQRVNDDEKISGAMGAAALDRRSSVQTTRTTATAPRLSLRPVTQFMPNFGERRSSKGAAIALSMASANNNPQSRRLVGNSPSERPSTSQSNHQENPFGNNAERLDAVSERSVPASGLDLQPDNPFNAPENVVGVAQTTDSPPEPSPLAATAAAGAVGAAAGVAAGISLTRKQSTRKDAPQTLDLTQANNAVRALGPVPAIPASPAGTEFSMTEVDPGQSPGPSNSAAAIAAAGGPPQSTVHRVQLDFKPSMDDEIELKAGGLVRLLHEYDDGWALCILLDRSRQGVCPRTCLSTRPVKPRPAGPPGARNGPPINPSGPRGPPRGPGPRYPPGQRPMTPQGGPYPHPGGPMRPMGPGGRPQSPVMMRPQSPAGMPRPQSPAGMGRPQSPGPRGPYNGRPQSPGPRAMSPGPRAQSPGPRQRGYSQSSVNGPRNNAPGPSPMNPASGIPPQQQGPAGSPPAPIGRKPVPGQAY